MSTEKVQLVGQDAIQKSYEAYIDLTTSYARLSPQRQGLTEEEFTDVIADPAVVATEVAHNGDTVQLPQLSPVERHKWLNADFYTKAFPDESARGNVLHFTEIPSTVPGPVVQARLRELAQDEGVLVFDYPTADPDYEDRLRAFLATVGIEAEDTQSLGNQTYFAGQVTLKRQLDPTAPRLTFAEAYQRAIADGDYDRSRIKDGASLQARVDPEQARVMQEFYSEAYEVLNDHPCNQGLAPDEFLEMATEKDWVTKIVNSADGEVQAICLLDNDLTELDWVNPEFYEEHFPGKAATKQIVWFPGLAASPDKKVGHNLQSMVNLIAELVDKGNNEMLVVFDCCDMNTGLLDTALNAMINATPQAAIDIQPIAVQRYCAIKTRLKQ